MENDMGPPISQFLKTQVVNGFTKNARPVTNWQKKAPIKNMAVAIFPKHPQLSQQVPKHMAPSAAKMAQIHAIMEARMGTASSKKLNLAAHQIMAATEQPMPAAPIIL